MGRRKALVHILSPERTVFDKKYCGASLGPLPMVSDKGLIEQCFLFCLEEIRFAENSILFERKSPRVEVWIIGDAECVSELFFSVSVEDSDVSSLRFQNRKSGLASTFRVRPSQAHLHGDCCGTYC